MRNEFVKLFLEKSKKVEKEIYFLTGDLGYKVLEPIQESLGDRFINVGVAEQNMIGLSAGLALSGKKVFVYSIVNFATLRCLEQIRNDICYHDLDVTIVVVGGGFAYGTHGYTHLGLEDISALMHFPNIKVVAPGDKKELSSEFTDIMGYDGPQYLRMARGGEPDFSKDISVEKCLDKANSLDLLIISHGPIGQNGIDASNKLNSLGYRTAAVSVPSLVPLPTEKIQQLLSRTKNCIVAEEHAVGGALGAQVAGLAASLGGNCPKLKCLGTDASITKIIGKTEYLRSSFSLDSAGLFQVGSDLLQATTK